jgi:hypothetical protein
LHPYVQATDIVLISRYDDLHGMICPLQQACELVLGLAPGTVISVLPGKVIYYEAEDPFGRKLMIRA